MDLVALETGAVLFDRMMILVDDDHVERKDVAFQKRVIEQQRELRDQMAFRMRYSLLDWIEKLNRARRVE